MATPFLIHDPAREAVAAMRGFSYQMLRSVQVWIELGEDEVLVLEGAEDLDIVKHGYATVEQVKDTSGSGRLSLGIAGVRNAIGYAWEHAANNPDVRLRFRYLSTASIGPERNDPLGFGVFGLTLWQSVRASPDTTDSHAAARAIADFLEKFDDLPAALRVLLREGKLSDIISRVILPIEWVTGRGEVDALRKNIEDRLIEFGAARGDTVLDSVGALGALHLEVWRRVVDKQRRPLTRSDFLRCFEGGARSVVSNSQLHALINLAIGVQSMPAAVPKDGLGPLIRTVPPLPPRFFGRCETRSRITEALPLGNVVVQGGTGMGKTSLMAFVAGGTPHAAWISLYGNDPAEIAVRLEAVQRAVALGRQIGLLVIDDLNPGADPRRIERPLADIHSTMAQRGGRLLIGCAQDLPPRLANAIVLAPDNLVRMRRFDREEIEAYLLDQGCPGGSAATWASLIWFSTSGHPQLVHARLATILLDGFPPPDPNGLLVQHRDVVDVQAEARSLIAQLPSDARELLLRSSLDLGELKRDRLIRIGRMQPPVSEPGAVVDRLVGAWLEYDGEGGFRVSPLLRGAALAINGTDWVRKTHRQLARSILAERTITATTLVMHVTAGGSAKPLIMLLPSLLQAEEVVWDQIADHCGFYVGIQADEARQAVHGLRGSAGVPHPTVSDRSQKHPRTRPRNTPDRGRRLAECATNRGGRIRALPVPPGGAGSDDHRLWCSRDRAGRPRVLSTRGSVDCELSRACRTGG